MADVFISYSSKNSEQARFLKNHLEAENISVFLASVSLKPGQQWSNNIKTNLNTSTWVIFLASKHSCKSAYVQQELGMAIKGHKKIVPILMDIYGILKVTPRLPEQGNQCKEEETTL